MSERPTPETSAERRAEYWKAEHAAANAEIDRLKRERDEAREALRKAIAQADFWFDDSTAGGKCPDLDDERALLARVDGEKPT